MSETKALASWVVKSRLEDIPDDVRHEALRAILNYTGCALGGSPDAAANIAMGAFNAEELHSPQFARGVGSVFLRQRQKSKWPRFCGRVHLGVRSRVANREFGLPGSLRRRLACPSSRWFGPSDWRPRKPRDCVRCSGPWRNRWIPAGRLKTAMRRRCSRKPASHPACTAWKVREDSQRCKRRSTIYPKSPPAWAWTSICAPTPINHFLAEL
jgi:MmgE/PrpD N-terminal domain